MTKRKLHLPASIKTLGILFALFFVFSFLFPSSVQALQCVSYGTCHYQSGTGLTCPSSPMGGATGLNDPFEFCVCVVDTVTNTPYKFKFNQCSSQEYCNTMLGFINDEPYSITPWRVACPYEYRGDFCGCSGSKKPLSETNPVITPTPTPTPTVIIPTPISTPTVSQSTCYQTCKSNADCSGNLACGYHVKADQRVCHNPACAGETDCTCDWQNSGIQAAFSRLKALGRKSQESNKQINKNSVVDQISQSLSSGLERAWGRLKQLRNN